VNVAGQLASAGLVSLVAFAGFLPALVGTLRGRAV
jgi:hypothetical protein